MHDALTTALSLARSRRNARSARVRAVLLSAGLEHAKRGLESFFAECFTALSSHPDLEVTLYKGSGPRRDGEIPVPTLRRDTRLAGALGALSGKNPWSFEAVSFAAAFVPRVVRHAPDVILFGDRAVGHVLWHVRRRLGLSYRLVLHNGSPIGPPYPRWDHVQHTAPPYLEAALAAGEPPEKHSLLPIGSFFEASGPIVAREAERRALREKLELPAGRKIVLSVAAINRSHKRVDYLVREVASLPAPRPFLVMLGEEEADGPEIRALATALLGTDGFRIATVPHAEVADFYRASDAFALCSLTEGFGRVYVEALAYGLPSIAHDSEVTRYVMGDFGIFADLEKAGALAAALSRTFEGPPPYERRLAQAQAIRDRFAWQKLGPKYADMLVSAAGSRAPRTVAS
jgi:glycosyltransferase involved in cell wall biosynthesis